jgi:serine phosphatase RsbU (regulator of sigma subunit)
LVSVCALTLPRVHALSFGVVGDPPPLRADDGVLSYLDVVFGPPLGIRDEHAQPGWPVTRSELPPGSSLLLYTDGLLDAYREVASHSSVGLDELLAAATEAFASAESLDGLLATVVGRAPTQAVDDTAMVVLSVGAEPA